ncbi:Ribonuclease H-like superfamily [Arabidopsis thaliana x Arabidopsis arenosa]|uniref:Ribonuclease H-like superfamily n=1 Tax=Arabidopsis thaliana x Arabidopsis arenosa TaxID=1240361 RepID=A0A8T2C980_9BRAS|nr:Ribonuclease H-like superfamily [Arabidopsis thaliana x Arabidopsis arenosa]
MSLPKKERGLGFKDLHNFNKALLAKQAWRIITNPSSLLARLYKGMYFPSTTYFQAKTGSQASYGWRSIQEGKLLLQKGLRSRLGDGTTTKVWEDPWAVWLPTLPPRPAHGPAIDADMVVADLWKNQREWDPNIFEGVLTPEDQQLARELYLSKYAEKDTYEWAYTQDARYTVRSGYWVATHVEVEEEERIEPPLGSVDLKQQFQQDKSLPPTKSLTPCWLIWRIWKSRNDFLFRKINRDPNTEARKGFEEANEWLEAQQNCHVKDSPNNQPEVNHRNSARNSQWEPPPPGWLKCNFDSGFIQGKEYTMTCWIIRDETGHMVSSGCAKLQKSYSALQAEALGFLHVLQVVWTRGHRCVWFEGDNSDQLVRLINTNGDHIKIGTLLYDIRQWRTKLPLSSLHHVNREKNAAADMLSKRASSINSMYETFTVPPTCRPHFTELFLTRSSAQPRLFFAIEKNGLWSFFSLPQHLRPYEKSSSSSLVVTAEFHMKFPPDNMTIYSRDDRRFSCGFASGLIYLYGMLTKEHYDGVPVICNPKTGHYATLPSLRRFRQAFSFLGFDPIDKQYKVLFMAYPCSPDHHKILTFGTGEMSWRRIKCSLRHSIASEGVCINGVVYYLGDTSECFMTGFVVVCFDVRSETFSFIYPESYCELINYKGKLGLVFYDDYVEDAIELRLWVLEDEERHEWSKYAYTLRDDKFLVHYVSIVGVTGTGEIVLSMTDYISKQPFYVFYFNPERNILQRVEIQGFGEYHEALGNRSRVYVFVDNVFGNDCSRFYAFADHVEDVNVIDSKLLKSNIYEDTYPKRILDLSLSDKQAIASFSSKTPRYTDVSGRRRLLRRRLAFFSALDFSFLSPYIDSDNPIVFNIQPMRAIMMIAKENSDPIRFFVTWVTVFCLSGDVEASILLAHSLEVTISILNFMIHDDADFLSCRAFFRRPLLCYCRRFVSDYVPFSVSNQLIIIGPRMKWRFRVLSFPSAFWFGDEIWIFDPGIVGSRIDNEGKLMSCFMQTPVHNTVSRQGQRIWWRVISLSLIFRIYSSKLLPCLSLSIKEFGRLSIVSLRLWGCQSGTRFMRWYSSLHQSWTLTITKNDVILKWKRCNRRSIAKLWKRITSYGEIVTEGVCRSTHEKCVDRHKSGTGTTGEVGVFFFSELVLVDAMNRMRIRRSDQQHVWVYGTITITHISFFKRVPKSIVLRCNRWIADFVFRKRKRWYIDKKQMFPKLESHTRLTDMTRATKHIIRIAAPKLLCFIVTIIFDCIFLIMCNITIFGSY